MTGSNLRLRRWHGQAPEALLDLLRRAIRQSARSCYSAEQIDAWLSTVPDEASWARRLADADVIVAGVDGRLAGFVALRSPGVVDLLFVEPDFARQGVGRALLAAALSRAHDRRWWHLECHASLLARPVFEAAGFRVLARQHVPRGPCRLTNFRMVAELPRPRS
ncbi:MAG: GNAT family N-acetyltransferase [Rhodocyclaceae bacterium]|nr:GNAT family N-acetyltransferase [Rhodocyclaceae bacterium]